MNRNWYRTALIAANCLVSFNCWAESAPSQIDLRKFPATQLDEVVVPLPSEVFNVLDKLGAPNWRSESRDPVVGTRGERAQIADPPIAQQLVPALVTLFRPCPYHGRAVG